MATANFNQILDKLTLALATTTSTNIYYPTSSYTSSLLSSRIYDIVSSLSVSQYWLTILDMFGKVYILKCSLLRIHISVDIWIWAIMYRYSCILWLVRLCLKWVMNPMVAGVVGKNNSLGLRIEDDDFEIDIPISIHDQSTAITLNTI